MAKGSKMNKQTSNVYDISSRKPVVKPQRKKAKKQTLTPRQKKRLTAFLMMCVGAIALIFVLIFLISKWFFGVDSITVKYTEDSRKEKHHYTDGEIASNSTIDKGDNLLFLDASEVASDLERALPYIDKAVIKKDFPSGVIIELKESNKVYCFVASSGYYLVNDSGKLLEKTNESALKKYMKVTCKNIEADVVGEKIRIGEDTDKILSYLELVRKSGLKIKHVNFTDVDDIKMNYDNRIVVHIGKMSHEDAGVTAWKKLQLAKKSLQVEDEANPDQEGTLDMTIAKKAFFSVKTEKPVEKKEPKKD